MSDKKNIERLFQEKFKDFEAIPSPKVWENIEAELHKKKKRRVIPIWFRLSGVAALLLIGAFIGYGILDERPSSTPENGVVNQENNNAEENHGKDLIPTKNPVQSNEVVTDAGNSENLNPKSSNAESSIYSNNQTTEDSNLNQKASDKSTISSEKINSKFRNSVIAHSSKNKKVRKQNTIYSRNNAIANSYEKSNISNEKTTGANIAKNKNEALVAQEKNASKEISNKNNSLENKNQIENKAIATKSDFDKEINKDKTQIAFDTKAIEKQKKDSTAVATVVPNPLEELLLQQEKEKQAVTETKVNRWQITSNVAPIYFSSASNGSPISEELADNNKTFEKNLSYGVGINYAFSNKWSVRSGVNKLSLGYNTNNIVYYAGLPNDARSANTFQATGTKIIIEDNSAANVVSFDNVPGKNNGYLNQSMGYIEIPVELSYKLLDRKFGIELIGGMSTLLLNENKLSVVSNGYSTSAGEATNLNDVSFSSNIGLGFKYTFWKSFQANVEPKLKYQLNTFSQNDGGFKPYFIGIYSGLSFSF